MGELHLWNEVIGEFKNQFGQAITDWLFNGSKLLKLDNEDAILLVDTFTQNSFSKFYLNAIETILYIKLNRKINFQVVTQELEIDAPRLNFDQVQKEISKGESPHQLYEDTNLINTLSFENYFYANENGNAVASAKKIIDDYYEFGGTERFLYVPIFIYGNSGYGKTHFVNAIGNEIFKSKRNLKILYTNATSFRDDFTAHFRSGLDGENIDDFTKRHTEVDVLIIDDIQMITGSASTQKKLFDILDYLINKRKLIIITSEQQDKFLPLEERLKTRIQAGAKIQIQQPDSDTKVQIFKYHARINDMNFSDEAVDMFVANSNSTRELLGYFKTLNLTRLTQANFDLVTEKDAYDVINSSTGYFRTSKETILENVSYIFDINITDLYKSSKKKNIVAAKKVSVILLSDMLRLTQLEIGKILGYNGHSAVNKILKEKDVIINQKEYKIIIENLSNKK